MKRPILTSFGCAFRGFWVALKTERNLKIQVVAGLVAIGVGFYLGLTAVEWGLVIFAVGLVLAAELFNTAMEKVCDQASHGSQIEWIKNCKDISAAAVLLAAITALIIGIIILIIPLFQRWF
jgi:diacylglycerol kinase (ATP)